MTGETPTGPSGLGRWQQPAAPTDDESLPHLYPLERILFCATCDQQFFGAHQFSGVRVYCTACTCRPRPLPADEVEKRVYAETHALASGTDTVIGLTKAHYAVLTIRFFGRIEVGLTVDDITFTARI
ncbi:MAG TPA: hypothetical protein VHJ83_02815 [Micromonosporaceae bacterium]|nr:hypothetical protein [Micromonosporaceae bacterium]